MHWKANSGGRSNCDLLLNKTSVCLERREGWLIIVEAVTCCRSVPRTLQIMGSSANPVKERVQKERPQTISTNTAQEKGMWNGKLIWWSCSSNQTLSSLRLNASESQSPGPVIPAPLERRKRRVISMLFLPDCRQYFSVCLACPLIARIHSHQGCSLFRVMRFDSVGRSQLAAASQSNGLSSRRVAVIRLDELRVTRVPFVNLT